MRRQRIERRLFWAGVVLALLGLALVGTILHATRAAAATARRLRVRPGVGARPRPRRQATAG